MDTEAFSACLDSGKYTDLVRGETSRAQSLGVRGTPTFVINGRAMSGALPFETFQRLIDEALAQADSGTQTGAPEPTDPPSPLQGDSSPNGGQGVEAVTSGDGDYSDATGLTPSVTFGDNGVYTVGLRVTDNGGAVATTTTTVEINNVDPSVTLDTSAAIAFTGGGALVSRAGVAREFQAAASDPGSDDLTFAWNSDSYIYFNNGVDADPAQSPDGIFPFTVDHTMSVVYDLPGAAP